MSDDNIIMLPGCTPIPEERSEYEHRLNIEREIEQLRNEVFMTNALLRRLVKILKEQAINGP